jgi:hypothetical protein
VQARRRELFTTIRTEGAILPPDLLQRVAAGDTDLGGLKPGDYHLFEGEPLNEAIVRSWNRLVGAWAGFSDARDKLPGGDLGTTVTRERWLLILFEELGYGRLQAARAVEIEGKSYAVSHAWGDHVAIHLVGSRVPLDHRSQGVAGAASMSPHGLVQELLNRSDERLWAFVSNGLTLRVLRDNSSLTRQAYVEFDLASMMDGDIYADFVVLWLVCHESRVEGDVPHDCWLERWSQEAVRQGTRALDGLRAGVESAISALGSGFLSHPANTDLRDALRYGKLNKQEYYRELLRLVYRLLFLFVAEDRGLLFDPGATREAAERYDRFYSSQRLRRLGESRRGSKHADLYQALRLVMEKLGDDDGCPDLGLPGLGSFLWSVDATPHLRGADLPNTALLDAVRALATIDDRGVGRSVDYRNLGAEELGSVYESLLELHPDLKVDAATFDLTTGPGNERRTTGSYYTPTSLISCLLDSALDPVLNEAAAKGEQAILDLKVCDPACGSGHFLVAAAHRIAKRLASTRTGDEEASPEAIRTALRDVVGRCLYGVDVNPMAVELCKVSLWMEAVEPGKPLNFLDAHVKCGNSLFGTTLQMVEAGVPDGAFKSLGGDDKSVARGLRSQNKTEREGQLTLNDVEDSLNGLEAVAAALESVPDDSHEAIHRKERRFTELSSSPGYTEIKLAADAWCAAFMQRKVANTPRITTGLVWGIASGGVLSAEVRDEVSRIAVEYKFFQWAIEFPQVFGRASSGFDVVLGNPPWEQTELAEREFFADHEGIAAAKTASKRKRLIEKLEEEDPVLFAKWIAALRRSEGASHFIRLSGRYPLCGRGRVNTYSIFAELMRSIVSPRGRVGCIVPTGIATDATTMYFFEELIATATLVSLFDFRNNSGFFSGIASAQGVRFCLLTMLGSGMRIKPAEFVFRGNSIADLSDPDRRFSLEPDDINLLNPNTHTCPIFMSSRDAQLTKMIYRRMPVLVNESLGSAGDAWRVTLKKGLFNMASDSHLFNTREELEAGGYRLNGNLYVREGREMLPLYEGKMTHHFHHRFGDYGLAVLTGNEVRQIPEAPLAGLSDPSYVPMSRYWVTKEAVEDALPSSWKADWLLVWRDITAATPDTYRTVVASIIPRVGVGDTMAIAMPLAEPRDTACLYANLCAFVLDYVSRQKVGGTHLPSFIFEQLAVATPSNYGASPSWNSEKLRNWIVPRVAELVYTSSDLKGFAADLGYDCGPFQWEPERRAMLRAELDAAFFHLYGLAEKDVDYVMETFPIVKRQDEERYGDYRTKAVILENYRAMDDAIASGTSYETRLDPPPADPRLARGLVVEAQQPRGSGVL